ncbi:60S ribosomal protein L37a [Babesia caballi]|uniref:60S ribosomal protein L37a n=1 Tax=Babesia caballi TaxID=5871 RepID=A0AAV4LYZ4_BABCB|nr:60S ribosomal protein L37a [Babesia caballi]
MSRRTKKVGPRSGPTLSAGRLDRQVRHPLRRLSEEAGQEDPRAATHRLQLPFLRKGTPAPVSVNLAQDATRWKAVGIWECKRCKRRVAGGAWSMSTSTGSTVKSTIERLYKQNVEAQ